MKTPALTNAKAQMQADPLMRAIWGISEAALAPDRWPVALQSITEAVGASGGNYVFLNKRTGNIEWVGSAGLSTDANQYVNYYAARDPYRPILEAASRGSWVQVSKCLPETFLRCDEWYNDFLLKGGIRDVAEPGSSRLRLTR